MRRLRPFAALVCLLLAVSGCGGGSPAGTPKPKPLTTAQATTIAAAGVLLPADLPGYTGEAQTADPSDAADQVEFDKCLGVPTSTYLAQDQGKSYTKGDLEIDSSSQVLTTAPMAKAEFDAADSAKGTACLKAQATAAAGADVSNAAVTVTTQSVTVPGADGALYFDFVLTGTAQGQQVEVRGSQAIARVGQTQVELDSFATAPPLLTTDEMVALLTKVVARVKTAAKAAS